MALETRTYQKENSLKFSKLLKASIKDIYGSRFLARQLATRDIKAQYRQSFLGILWAFVTPIATALVWIVLNGSGAVSLTDTGMPYPLYAFTGTLIWSILTEAVNSPIQSTNNARGILSKINFPKEALIISGIYKLIFNSSVKILLLIFFVIVYGVSFNWGMLTFPFAILAAVLIGTTFGLLITPMGLLYKDVGRMIKFVMQFVMYATPVVYIIPDSGLLRTLMLYNPLTPLLTTSRDLILGVTPEYLSNFAIVLLCCVPLVAIALIFYRISIPIIVERISS